MFCTPEYRPEQPSYRIGSWRILVAHQDKHYCRRRITVVFGNDTVANASWNALITGSLIAV
jgi:hypothetical protein